MNKTQSASMYGDITMRPHPLNGISLGYALWFVTLLLIGGGGMAFLPVSHIGYASIVLGIGLGVFMVYFFHFLKNEGRGERWYFSVGIGILVGLSPLLAVLLIPPNNKKLK